MFTEAIEAILVDQCTPAAIRAIENGGSANALWGALAESGFLELMASAPQSALADPPFSIARMAAGVHWSARIASMASVNMSLSP